MTIEKVYPQLWGVGEILRSSQVNDLDANVINALDKRAGQGDVLMSTVIATGTGRIISSIATGPDADITFQVGGGNSIVRVPTLTSARSYTLGHSGATGGDRMLFFREGTGGSPSGYVDLKNNVGTGLFRLGVPSDTAANHSVEGREAELVFNGSAWQLLRGTPRTPGVLASLAALTAIPTPTDGLTRHVSGYGWYTFRTSATSGLTPFRIASDDATTGGWLSDSAHETTLVRLVLPGWCPLRSSTAAATPALTGPVGTPADASMTTTRGSVQFLAVTTGSAIALGFAASINEFLVDGATLTSIRARWKPNPTHVDVPLLLPKFGVIRADYTNGSVALLSTGSGFVTDTPADTAAANTEHYLPTFTPDQNNVIDKTLYHYAIVAFNEGHTNSLASGSFYAFELTQTITDARRA